MLIDTHFHLFHHKHTKTPENILTEAREWGVTKFITIGTSLNENKPVIKAVAEITDLYGAIGVYPHENLNTPVPQIISTLEQQLMESNKIVAIGECGIDITEWQGGRKLNDQIELFEAEINLAIKHKLPVIIHNRNGEKQVLELLQKYVPQGLTGVIHCFVSNWEFAQKVLDLGFYLSFAGNITYPSNKHMLEIVEKVPIDRFLVETDAPYLPPQGYRGQVNETKYVKIIAEKVADTKKLSFEETCGYEYNNAVRLFKLV